MEEEAGWWNALFSLALEWLRHGYMVGGPFFTFKRVIVMVHGEMGSLAPLENVVHGPRENPDD